MPFAISLIQDKEGRILLHRGNGKNEWELPCYAMALGERIDYTCAKAVYDKLGLKVNIERLIGIYSGENHKIVSPVKNRIKTIDLLFHCRIVGDFLYAEAHRPLETAFFSPNALPDISGYHARLIMNGLEEREESFF